MGLLILGMVAAGELKGQAEAEGKRRIVVCIARKKLVLLEGDKVIKIYQTAVGAPHSPSPVGRFSIVQRLSNPGYYKPGIIIPPGEANPLGTRWLGLSVKGFGIHGTNEPKSIGKARSHGCIRLHNRDVEDLFTRVSVGDVVELCREADEQIAWVFASQPGSSPARANPAKSLRIWPASPSLSHSAGL
jgi:lipoprotein-anchoring transpeptidase ErfK/SrfK